MTISFNCEAPGRDSRTMFLEVVSRTMRSYEETEIDILLQIFSKEENYTLLECEGIAMDSSNLL